VSARGDTSVTDLTVNQQIDKGRAEREKNREWRVQRYRVKAAYLFTCQYEGCEVDHNTQVVNLDGSPWLPDQERADDELTVRCKAHRAPDPEPEP
jgi:hypothetical protein